MPSQFFGLQIGYSGVTAYQAALTTTGNNIANVETKGYSRQVTNQKASQALRTYTSYGMAGSGTTVTSIDQVRSAYYDIKFRSSTSSYNEYNTKSEYMSQIENFFNDDGEMVQGFNTVYDSFYRSLEDVKNDPGDVAVRTTFIGKAQALSEYFNSMSLQLSNLQQDVNDQVKIAVDQINSIAEQISTLNKQINIIEIKGTSANELRDERNLLVDELAKYVNVEVTESPIYTTSATDENGKPLGELTGTSRFTVVIAGNNTLVDGYEYRTLNCTAREGYDKTNQSDANGLYDICWSDTGVEYYPTGLNESGTLKGLLQMRDGNNNEYFRGQVVNYDSSNRAITVNTKDAYLADINKCTLNGTGQITLGNGDYRYEKWSAVEEPDGTYTYTFYLASKDKQTIDNSGSRRDPDKVLNLVGKAATVGAGVDYQGIPYYQEQMNEWVRIFAKTFNEIEQQGEDIYGNSLAGNAGAGIDPTAFFMAASTVDYNFADAYETVITNETNCYYQLTAGNLSVNSLILADGGKMSTTAKQGDINLDAHDIVDMLKDIKDQKNFFRGSTSAQFLQCVLGDIALNANSANTFSSNFENIQSSIENQRLSVSGVDDDEEALNLVKYQNAYNLSAKMIQVMTEIYDRLINQTGI